MQGSERSYPVNPCVLRNKDFLTWLLMTMFHLASQGPIVTFILAFLRNKD